MKSQNDPTMPEQRKLLVAGAGIAIASRIPHVSAVGLGVQGYSDTEAPMKS